MIKNGNALKDTLYYLDADSGTDLPQAKGVVLGVVSALMATGCSFEQAIRILAEHVPHTYRIDAIPEIWRSTFVTARSRLTRI